MIKPEQVLKIAKLANIEVPEGDLDGLCSHLGSILEHFAELEKVDVAQIEPMSHVQSGVNVFREDKVEPSLNIENALRNTPDVSGRFIRVPLIIEGNTEH